MFSTKSANSFLAKVVSFISAVALVVVIASPALSFAHHKDTHDGGPDETPQMTICHKNGESGNWNELTVDENGWSGHDGHADDFLIEGDNTPCPPEETDEPTEEELCELEGGNWVYGECLTDEELCDEESGFWNGEYCEEIPSCDDGEVYNDETNICDEVNEEQNESEIIQPEPDEITSGTTDLEAYYADENGDGNDGVQWAVRAGTCAAGTNTVFGNVDGYNTPFDWDGTNFFASIDTTTVENGEYCFIFNPTEDGGDENQRLTRTFFIENDEEEDDSQDGGDSGDDSDNGPSHVEYETLACGETTFTATTNTSFGNLYLVVDDGEVHTTTLDGSITVGPYEDDRTISYRVFGGPERDWDIPLWNGYGESGFISSINAYGGEHGWSWVTSGVDDSNPFTTWTEIMVEGCPTEDTEEPDDTEDDIEEVSEDSNDNTPPSFSSAPRGGGGYMPRGGSGEVLGATTCGPILSSFLRTGRPNDEDQVKILQQFLNGELGLELEVNGVFSQLVHDAVVAFQLKYAEEVLAPWVPHGLTENTGTGYVYKTTQRMINKIACPSLEIPMPELY